MTGAEGTSMSLLDRCRIRLAAWWYGAWLEYYGITRRRRHDLRQELRANLAEAAASGSARTAIRDLGGLRDLAAAVARDGVLRPRWHIAAVAAFATWGLLINIQFIAALNYVQGVLDSGGDAVTGSVVGFPGSTVAYQPEASGFSATFGLGWLAPAVAVMVFILTARPWRLLRRPAVRGRLGINHD